MLIQQISKSHEATTTDPERLPHSDVSNSAGAGTCGAREPDIFTIGDIARIYGVSLRALRFYEERQLLQPERRGVARLYDRAARKRLELILKGKQLGFTLTEIRDMIARGDADTQAGDLTLAPSQVHDQLLMLERQRAEIDHAIAELRATQMRFSEALEAHSPLAACHA